MYALYPLPATIILKTDTTVTHSFSYSTTYELPHGTGHGATAGDGEVGETGMVSTLTEIDQEYLFCYSNLSSYFSVFNILSSKRDALNHTL